MKQAELIDVGRMDAAPVEQTPMTLIQLAVEHDAPPEKLEKLMALQERWEAKIAKERFDDAFSKFQGACPHIQKTRMINLGGGKGPTYASYDDIMKVVQPLLTKFGLSVAFDTDVSEAGTLKTVCRVKGFGHTEVSSLALPVPSNMKVNETQKMGAANSYGKRYAVENALNIVVTDQDVDARGADTEFMSDEQVNRLEVLLDAAEDKSPGSKARFMGWLEENAGVDSLTACPASYYPKLEKSLKGKLAAR